MAQVRTIVSICLSLVFLLSTSGISVVYHYCAGEISSISVAGPKGCACGEEKGRSCCHEEIVTHQVKTDFLKTAEKTQLRAEILLAVLPALFRNIYSVPELSYDYARAPESPPPPDNITIRFRSLLI